MSEDIGMFAITGLAATLVLGGWHSPVSALYFIPSYVWFFAKLSALLFVYIWLRGTLPRTRIDQIMNFAWKFICQCLLPASSQRLSGIMQVAACADGFGRLW